MNLDLLVSLQNYCQVRKWRWSQQISEIFRKPQKRKNWCKSSGFGGIGQRKRQWLNRKWLFWNGCKYIKRKRKRKRKRKPERLNKLNGSYPFEFLWVKSAPRKISSDAISVYPLVQHTCIGVWPWFVTSVHLFTRYERWGKPSIFAPFANNSSQVFGWPLEHA